MAAAVRAGEVSALELVERALERIELRDGEVNSCVRVLAEEALAAAAAGPSGPLAGVPVTVKEIFAMKGERSTWGAPGLHATTPASADDPHVARLRRAGAVVVARTNVPELSCWGTTDNPVYGVTANPRDPARTPGGSSGGAAASVALGIAPLALGSDAGGSIRIPASFCGVVGLKPSFETLPADRGPAFVSRLNCAGPLAGSVADAALALGVLAGRPPAEHEPPARIGYSADLGFAPVAAEVREGFEAALERLRGGGLELRPAAPPPRSPLPFIVPMLAHEVNAAFAELLAREDHGLSAETVAVAGGHGTIGGAEYVRLAERRVEFEAAWRRFFRSWDVLVTPTTQVTAFELGRHGPDAIEGVAIDPEADGSWYPTCFVANVLGAPAVSIPSGVCKRGLPLGVQLMGAPGSDDLVLSAAQRAEAQLGL